MEESALSTELAVANQSNVAVMPSTDFGALIPTEQELAIYHTLAQEAQDSRLFNSLGGKPGIVSIMLYARELNVQPMRAIAGGMHVVQGRVVLSAQLMGQMIRHARHTLQTIELTMEKCRIYGKRRDNGDDAESEFTIEEAEMAGLVKKDSNWMKFRKDMLYARALSRMGRQLFQDVIGGAYIEGEITDDAPYDVKPLRRGRQAKPQTILQPTGAAPSERVDEPSKPEDPEPPIDPTPEKQTEEEPEATICEPDPGIVAELDSIVRYLRNTHNVAQGGLDYLEYLVCSEFGVKKSDQIPGDQIDLLRKFVKGRAFADLAHENWLPMKRNE